MDQVSRALGGDATLESPLQAYKSANEMCAALVPQLGEYEAVCARINKEIGSLSRAIESMQGSYNQIKREKDAYTTQLTAAEARLAEVQRVVQRYAVVTSPVVASDGYTYERDTIKSYLDDCKTTGTRATSQQTHTELGSALIPNHSLKKLVDLLKTYKPPSAESKSAAAAPVEQPRGADAKNATHPCVRVYGFCNYKDNCTYAQYPYDACLSHLKGKCRFGTQCHELHVEIKGHHSHTHVHPHPHSRK